MDWNNSDEGIVCVLMAPPQPDPMKPSPRHIMMLFHNGVARREFSIPPEVRHLSWRLFVDTAAESPRDVFPSGDGPAAPAGGSLQLVERSMLVFVAGD